MSSRSRKLDGWIVCPLQANVTNFQITDVSNGAGQGESIIRNGSDDVDSPTIRPASSESVGDRCMPPYNPYGRYKRDV